jgi:hypothetical protein
MYYKGNGVPQNYAEALKWFRLAATQGHAKAQSNLGVMYDEGQGVPEDDAGALKWYRLAAAQGNASAQFLLVGNAYHIKTVPGRKTDVKDAEWIADLLRHGQIRGSFIPTPAQRHLRDLTRYRTHVVEERARLTNRLQMVLEDANVKLASVVTDIRGTSARAILSALVAGETNPTVLADLTLGRRRSKRAILAQAVAGRFTPIMLFC